MSETEVTSQTGAAPAQKDRKYPLALPMNSVLNGRFLLQNVLGQGGFGITYLALDLTDQSRVAIKEYFPQEIVGRVPGSPVLRVNQEELQEQFQKGLGDFLREGKILAAFNGDPHIVGARRFFEENGTAYLVMEYVDGTSLKAYLKARGGSLPWQETVKIMRPVMQALATVHKAGICHRDVAPDNIYLTSDGNVKLLDFGAARSGISDRSMTVLLKPGFTPLEQYNRKGKQGPYTDVYAVAATLYRCITGQLPLDVVDRMQQDLLPTISALGIPTPKSLEDAIMKGLSIRAPGRFQTMEAFLSAISGIENEAPGLRDAEDDRTIPDPQGFEPPKKKKTRIWPIAGAAALVLVLAAGAAVMLLSGRDQPEASADNPLSAPVHEALPTGTTLEQLQQQAEAGDPEAQFELGQRYAYGNGLPLDMDLAAQWYEKAALQGHVNAQYQMGLTAREAKDEAAAFDWFRQAAEQNHAAAQYQMGMALLQGAGTEPSPEEGFSRILKSAEQGYPQAQFALGQCYEQGTGTQADPQKAVDSYRSAAGQGLPEAQFSLARCLYDGRGTELDLKEAVLWYEKAAEQGHWMAQVWTAYCYYQSLGVPGSAETAEKWYDQLGSSLAAARQQAQSGDPEAAFAYALYLSAHEQLVSPEKALEREDLPEAFRLFQETAAQGHIPAMYHLGLCYHRGIGIKAYYAEGIRWMEQAYAQDSTEAGWYLGLCLEEGFRVPVDHQKAFAYLQDASDSGNINATAALVSLYVQGHGVQADPEEARRLCELCREEGYPHMDQLDQLLG